jgi:hypothetical protein
VPRLRTGETVAADADAVAVVDTTGAWDAFNAGFLTGWLQGWPVAMCLSLGNARAAVAVGRVGGAGDIAPLPDPVAPSGDRRSASP